MAPAPSQENNAPANSDADLAQISEAWTKIAQGEMTAQALESNLTSLEKKIDDLLASFEESERAKVEQANGTRNGDGKEGKADANAGGEKKA